MFIKKCKHCGREVERSIDADVASCFTCKSERRKELLAKGKVLEKDIQREICDYLFSKGVFFWRSNNVPVFAMSGSGFRRFHSMPKYAPKGLPDIICLVKGRFIGLEVKRPNNPSKTGHENQIEMGKKIDKNGGLYKIVFSLNDVLNIPELWA